MKLILEAIKSIIRGINNSVTKHTKDISDLSAQVRTVKVDANTAEKKASKALSEVNYANERINELELSKLWGNVSLGSSDTTFRSLEVVLPQESSEIVISGGFVPKNNDNVHGTLYINDKYVGTVVGGESGYTATMTVKVRLYGNLLLSEQTPKALSTGTISSVYSKDGFSKITKVRLDFLSEVSLSSMGSNNKVWFAHS